eukprot:gene20564-biopygen20612
MPGRAVLPTRRRRGCLRLCSLGRVTAATGYAAVRIPLWIIAFVVVGVPAPGHLAGTAGGRFALPVALPAVHRAFPLHS